MPNLVALAHTVIVEVYLCDDSDGNHGSQRLTIRNFILLSYDPAWMDVTSHSSSKKGQKKDTKKDTDFFVFGEMMNAEMMNVVHKVTTVNGAGHKTHVQLIRNIAQWPKLSKTSLKSIDQHKQASSNLVLEGQGVVGGADSLFRATPVFKTTDDHLRDLGTIDGQRDEEGDFVLNKNDKYVIKNRDVFMNPKLNGAIGCVTVDVGPNVQNRVYLTATALNVVSGTPSSLCLHGENYWNHLSNLCEMECKSPVVYTTGMIYEKRLEDDRSEIYDRLAVNGGGGSGFTRDGSLSAIQNLLPFLTIPTTEELPSQALPGVKSKLESIAHKFRPCMENNVLNDVAFSLDFIVATRTEGTVYNGKFLLITLDDKDCPRVEKLEGDHGQSNILLVTLADRAMARRIREFHVNDANDGDNNDENVEPVGNVEEEVADDENAKHDEKSGEKRNRTPGSSVENSKRLKLSDNRSDNRSSSNSSTVSADIVIGK